MGSATFFLFFLTFDRKKLSFAFFLHTTSRTAMRMQLFGATLGSLWVHFLITSGDFAVTLVALCDPSEVINGGSSNYPVYFAIAGGGATVNAGFRGGFDRRGEI